MLTSAQEMKAQNFLSMHLEQIKRSCPWPGVLTSFYLSFSPTSEKLDKISKIPFFWGWACLCVICNWILLYSFCFIVATCNSKVRLVGMRPEWQCACVPVHLWVRERRIKETPKETAEQEQIVKSAVPSQSNWGTWCSCRAPKTHVQIWPQRKWAFRGWPGFSAIAGWQQGHSISRTSALPAAGREQGKFTLLKGMCKD